MNGKECRKFIFPVGKFSNCWHSCKGYVFEDKGFYRNTVYLQN